MNNKIPANLIDIVECLTGLSENHDLIKRATDNCYTWINNYQKEIPWDKKLFEVKFKSIALYFKNNMLSYPYITTTLELYIKDQYVGYYQLITLLDGEVDDDYFVLEKTNE